MALRSDSTQIIIDPATPTLVFQYNPETLTHTFSPPNGEEVLQKEVKGGANSLLELISLSLELDAADQLEHPGSNRDVVGNGLHPALAVLETIMLGQSKTARSKSPVLVFLFGRNRTVPVWLDSLKVVEDAFDPNLNPVRVRIELVMRVRGLSEFKKGSPGYAVCAGHLNLRRSLTKLYPLDGSVRELFQQVARGGH